MMESDGAGLRVPLHRRGAVSLLAALLTLASPGVQAAADELIAKRDVILCKTLGDLETAQRQWQEQNQNGIALYFKAPNPPCLNLAKGEHVEKMDHAGNAVQVITGLGTPRFIGWGHQDGFGPVP